MAGFIKRINIVTLAEDYAGSGVTRCLAQHGVSLFIELEYSDQQKQYMMFDTGDYVEPILFNANKLDVPLKNLDTIILSHSHYDHTGGLIGIVKEIGKKIKVVAHPDVFKQTFYEEDHSRNIGMEHFQAKEVTEQYGAEWELQGQPYLITDGVLFLGEIPRETEFENELTIQLHKVENGQFVRDNIEDDTGMAIETNKGLIVIAGCSHSGITNIVKHAKKVTGKEVYAVIGGFHLLSASDERIISTTDALHDLGVKKVITGHCTGGNAEYIMQKRFREDFQKLYAGKIMEFQF